MDVCCEDVTQRRPWFQTKMRTNRTIRVYQGQGMDCHPRHWADPHRDGDGPMTFAREVNAAARRILEGDDSTQAAAALEAALHTYHPYQEEFDDILEVLALYSPLMGSPYTDHRQICDEIRKSPIGNCEGSDG